MAYFLTIDKRIHKIWAFDRNNKLKGLLVYAQMLKKEHFDFVYDAHSNIRSFVLKSIIIPYWKRIFFQKPALTVKHKQHFKRFLLFNLRINLFPIPFRGMIEFQKPLYKWGITDFNYTFYKWQFPTETIKNVKAQLSNHLTDAKKWITIVPSAAWKLKRWPIEYWKRMIILLPNYQFVILAGPKDDFCEDIKEIAPTRTLNLAGKMNLLESLFIVSQSQIVIAADTGLLHATDLFGTKGIVLRGPTAFGAPTGKHITTLEVDMYCRPCTKHGNTKCKRKIHQQCMVEITPETVAGKIMEILSKR